MKDNHKKHSKMKHEEMDHSDHEEMDHSKMKHDKKEAGDMDCCSTDDGKMDHDKMNHEDMDHSSMDHDDMDHSKMDHSGMDHGEMDHSKMDHGSHGDHMSAPGMAQEFLKKFFIVTALLVPLFILSEAGMNLFGYNEFSARKWIVFGISTIVFWIGRIFFQHAKHEIQMRKYGMMTLVSMGVGAGYLFSVLATFMPSIEVEFYLEVSTLVWVLLFGHYLEARASSAAGDAMKEVAKLLPSKAHLVTAKGVEDVELSELKVGNIVLVKPGEKVPADGSITKGLAHFNEAHISGESKPVNKNKGDEVVAGAICEDGTVEIKLDRVGADSTIGQIQTLIAQAQTTKPTAQRIADKASSILTFAALAVAILTVVIWSLIVGAPFVFAITLAITVLVIACPHALGLAIPTVTTIATKLSVDNGIFIKDMSKLEVLKAADYIVFDKTGTLTEGNFGVTELVGSDLSVVKIDKKTKLNTDNKESLAVVLALEKLSSHVIGDSIVEYADKQSLKEIEVEKFKNISGQGVSGEVNGKQYWIGSPKLLKDKKLFTPEVEKLHGELSSQGKTVVYLMTKDKMVLALALSDQIRSDSKQAIDSLHSLGLKVAMLTGDNETVAKGVAQELGIDDYFAEVLPEDKYKHIRELQEAGNVVVMIGDGVNDAPALTQADVGVAIGAGTDVAVEAGDAVLTRDNPNDAAKLIKLSRKVYRKMQQNLFWALGYNIVAIPAAAGLFVSFGFRLSPGWGALLMSLSSVIVVINAITLRYTKLS